MSTSSLGNCSSLLVVKAATLRGETKHIENDNLTISDYVDLWFEKNCKKKKWSDNSVLIREQAIRLHFKPLLGRYKLQNLNDVILSRKLYRRVSRTVQA
ncbi:hypothetical protein [Lysinibacillus sp. NPDC047702]|uniref:hypothetical protein n=1 Tax=unclassified Lysinibacillus TaxID=2636778 RepID=UPI003D07D69E